MAKIGNLEVDTLKIDNTANELTQFFYSYNGANGNNRYIDITYDALNIPVMIWCRVSVAPAELWITVSGTPSRMHTFTDYSMMVISDLRSAGTYTYTLAGGTATITGAMKRYK